MLSPSAQACGYFNFKYKEVPGVDIQVTIFTSNGSVVVLYPGRNYFVLLEA